MALNKLIEKANKGLARARKTPKAREPFVRPRRPPPKAEKPTAGRAAPRVMWIDLHRTLSVSPAPMDELLKALAAIAWLVTTVGTFIMLLRQNAINREMARLNTALGMSVKGFEHELGKALSTFNNRHSIFCVKQAEVLAEIYSKLWQIRDELTKQGCTRDLSEYNTASPSYITVFDDAAKFFLVNRFYFTDAMAAVVQSLLGNYNRLSASYFEGHRMVQSGQRFVEHGERLRKLHKEIEKQIDDCQKLFHATLSAS